MLPFASSSTLSIVLTDTLALRISFKISLRRRLLALGIYNKTLSIFFATIKFQRLRAHELISRSIPFPVLAYYHPETLRHLTRYYLSWPQLTDVPNYLLRKLKLSVFCFC